MSRAKFEENIDARLRSLDRAPRIDDDDRVRQAALLDRLLASDPTVADDSPRARMIELLPTAPRRGRRNLSLIAAAAVLAAAALVLPVRGTEFAVASWTPRPTAVTSNEAAQAVAACQDRIGTIGGGGGKAGELSQRLVERRGEWVLVLLDRATPENGQYGGECIVYLPAGSGEQPRVVAAGAGSGGGYAPPTGHQLMEGGVAQFGPDDGLASRLLRAPRLAETVSATSGRVGPDVVAVTIHAGGRTVEASIVNGTYAAWWPGTAFNPATLDAPSGRGGPEPAITYDVTLRDGTVLQDVTSVYS
jgi:hypothetical protein